MQKITYYRIEIKQLPKADWHLLDYNTINITDKLQKLSLITTNKGSLVKYLINPLALSSILADTLKSDVVLIYTDFDLGESTNIKLSIDFQDNILLRIRKDSILSSEYMLPILIDNVSEFLSKVPSIEFNDLTNDEILEKFSHNKSHLLTPQLYE